MPFQLEKYKTPSSRYTCPGCGQRRKFTRYIDTATGVQLADHVGRCDRQDSCGYHYTPRQYFADHPLPGGGSGAALRPIQPIVSPAAKLPASPVATSYLPDTLMEASETAYAANHLVVYLLNRYDEAAVLNRIGAYHIGTSRHWPGASIFWQIDALGRIRTGKVMLYDAATGRRVREPVSRISWVHSLMGIRDYRLSQCLYGEHLVYMDRRKPIAITESEKTAIIASIHMPEYYWLATGGKEQLSPERMAVLRGRRVTLFPDAGGYELWQRRAAALAPIVRMPVSDLLERHGRDGMDIADWP